MLGRCANTSTAAEPLNSLLKVVSAVCRHVSYSRGKSPSNFALSATIPSICTLRLLKMLTTSALRSSSDETRSPNINTTTIEPPNSSQPCQRFNCLAIFLAFLVSFNSVYSSVTASYPSYFAAIAVRAIEVRVPLPPV